MTEKLTPDAEAKAEIERLEKQLEEARKDAADFKIAMKTAQANEKTKESLSDAKDEEIKRLRRENQKLADGIAAARTSAEKAEKLLDQASVAALEALREENARLRFEVSRVSQRLAALEKESSSRGQALLRTEHARRDAERRFNALESSAAVMQRARDEACGEVDGHHIGTAERLGGGEFGIQPFA